MAATAKVIATYDIGNGGHLYVGELSLDASYPAGGYVVDLPNNQRIEILLTDDHGGYSQHWDRNTQKMLVQRGGASTSTAQAEVAGGTNLSTVTGVPFLAIGA